MPKRNKYINQAMNDFVDINSFNLNERHHSKKEIWKDIYQLY
jgi:hypothetical protein